MSTFRLTSLRGVQPASGSAVWRMTSLRGVGVATVLVLVNVTGKDYVEGNEKVILRAVISGEPSLITFQQIAGPTVPFTVVGSDLTYYAPAHIGSGAVDMTWRVTVSAVGSPDAVATSTQYVWPCSFRRLTASGWQPVTEWMFY